MRYPCGFSTLGDRLLRDGRWTQLFDDEAEAEPGLKPNESWADISRKGELESQIFRISGWSRPLSLARPRDEAWSTTNRTTRASMLTQ